MSIPRSAGFRPDIEGLRALAVVAVILAHAQVPWFGGGYLGVDMFYAISGFVIARSILADQANGTFSLAGFYERRARRILPALLVMVATVLLAGVALLSFEALQDLGQSVFATVAMSNNLLLTDTAGYWGLEASFRPLLHTWSLAVEEQYYLAAPLLFVALAPQPRRLTVVLAASGLASLALALAIGARWPDAAFYLAPTRAWQILAGMLAAIAPAPASRPRPALAALGLGIVTGALLFGVPGAPFPSLASVAAVAGTGALLLCGGGESGPGRWLGARPLVVVGGMSYALYLWHQPLFAFRRAFAFQPPAARDYLVLLPALAGLAWLSTRWLERPYRDPRRIDRRALVTRLGAGAAILAAAGLTLHVLDGLPGRNPATAPLAGEVPADYNERIRAYATATFPSGRAGRILLLGNSRARDFGNVLAEGGVRAGNALVYRADTQACGAPSASERSLLRAADWIVIESAAWAPGCAARLGQMARPGARISFLGPRSFGYSIEPYLLRDRSARIATRIPASPADIELVRQMRLDGPGAQLLDWYALAGSGQAALPLFDEAGVLLSADGVHLTRAGARYFARLLSQAGALRVPVSAW